jgi:hypothetical protein
MKIPSQPYRPSGTPKNNGFCPEYADPHLRLKLPQEPLQHWQQSYKSLFGFDLGATHTFGESAQLRWALNFVAIYCLLHLDRSSGFVRELEDRCSYRIDVLRANYPAGSFPGFLEGNLRKVAHLSLSDAAVQRALRKAVRLNFKRTAPQLSTEAMLGFKPNLLELEAAAVHEALEDSFEKALGANCERVVRQPGQWMTEEEWRKYEPYRIKVVYAPEQTCKKGGRSVQF